MVAELAGSGKLKEKEMLVYFHIDELARDAVVASALKKELKQKGGELIYGNRVTSSLMLRHFSLFDAIILPSLAHFIDAFPDATALPDNVFILQTEAIGQATGTLRRLNGKYFGDDAKKCEPWHQAVRGFLLWGYSHLNPFKTFYPDYLSKCKVVGHPRLSKSCSNPKNSGNKKAEKPVVGFVSRFNLLSPFDNRTPFESVCSSMKFGKTIFPLFENSPDKDVEDMYYTEVIDFRIMLQVMMSLNSSHYEITVRPHPRENRQSWEKLAKKLGINIKISPWDEPFGHWLQGVDLIVMPPSTSLYDVFYHKKLPILTSGVVPTRANHILTESDDNNQILEGVCRPDSVEEIVSIIETAQVSYNEEIVRQRLLEQVAADIADSSITNVIDALQNFSTLETLYKRPMKQRFVIAIYKFFAVAFGQARWLKRKMLRRIEQGSSFDLTIQRVRWIDRLTMSE